MEGRLELDDKKIVRFIDIKGSKSAFENNTFLLGNIRKYKNLDETNPESVIGDKGEFQNDGDSLDSLDDNAFISCWSLLPDSELELSRLIELRKACQDKEEECVGFISTVSQISNFLDQNKKFLFSKHFKLGHGRVEYGSNNPPMLDLWKHKKERYRDQCEYRFCFSYPFPADYYESGSPKIFNESINFSNQNFFKNIQYLFLKSKSEINQDFEYCLACLNPDVKAEVKVQKVCKIDGWFYALYKMPRLNSKNNSNILELFEKVS